jgi:hypothetical protein
VKFQKGIVGIWLIFLIMIVIIGVMLTGGTSVMQRNKTTAQADSYLVADDSVGAVSDKSLQLKTINFTEVKTTTADCGHGPIKGRNEEFVLWATDPGPGQFAGQGGTIKAFYADEWPITLGSGAVSALTKSPDHITTVDVGNETEKDSNGFPYFPAIFITDITNNPDDRSGDAQNGGIPHKPDEIFGVWKALGSSGSSRFGRGRGNGLDLGDEADTFPSKSNLWENTGQLADGPPEGKYSAEVLWKVDNLGLLNGHNYRVQIVLHDGDFAGDIGQACTTIKY